MKNVLAKTGFITLVILFFFLLFLPQAKADVLKVKGDHPMESFAGANPHKKVIQLAVLRKRKPPSQYRFRNDPHTVEKVLRRLPFGSKVAVEATGNWWWFVEQPGN